MKFNSFEFLCFLTLVFFIFWWLKNSSKYSNIFLLVASYVFYAWWDYRFLLLIFFSSLVDFIVGWYLPGARHKKLLMGISLSVNLGLLMFFKYYNFFVEAAHDSLSLIGVHGELQLLNIILPVGISFYTFQTLSYSLDIYRGKIQPERNIINFLNYVSFFPQLVAGPIERASSFLPQFTNKKAFNYEQSVIGMRLLLYGFFKKIVVADNVAMQVDAIFSEPGIHNSATLFIGCMLFFIQLYADFSAYTDIARGIGKLLGFELMENFKNPFFSQSVPEFWAHWHISLTTWFRDYFFIPLAKVNKSSTLWRITATIILFVTIGFWHGANYTYILFGFMNGVYFIPKLLTKESKALRKGLSYVNNHKYIKHLLVIGTFVLNTLTGIIFRSDDLGIAKSYYENLFLFSPGGLNDLVMNAVYVSIAFMLYEYLMQSKIHPFEISSFPPIMRRVIYVSLTLTILFYGNFAKDPFYYFQF